MSKKKDKTKQPPPVDPPADSLDETSSEAPVEDGSPPVETESADRDPMATLQNERDEMYERLQRVSADYQNYMRRSQEQLGKQLTLARGDVIKNFFAVLDHFDTALGHEPTSDEARSLHQGVAIVRDEFLRVMQNEGVTRIEAEVGEPFDPQRHEAMLRQPADGIEPNCISAAFSPGYAMGDLTLRPAKVAVAPEGAPAPADVTDDAPAADDKDED